MTLQSFCPPANLDDLTPAQRAAWSNFISNYLDGRKNTGEVREQFFNPLGVALGADQALLPIRWTAFPKQVALTFSSDLARWREADRSRDVQDEYCEWSVERAGDKIKRVTFTCEGPEYWTFLANTAPGLALALYQRHISPNVRREDLFTTAGAYIERNQWNAGTKLGAMHLIQPANTLRAEMELAAAATIKREHDGQILTSEQDLIACSRYGVASRHSDPHIGGEVNALARRGAMITLADPIGLYLDGLSTAGWTTPDGADPQSFWTITRGTKDFAVRAVYEVTAGHDYLVGDIKINDRAIRYGAQIADHITIRLTGLAHQFGTSTAAPQPCIGQALEAAPGPLDVTAFLDPRATGRR